jgi:hypothetical protein
MENLKRRIASFFSASTRSGRFIPLSASDDSRSAVEQKPFS